MEGFAFDLGSRTQAKLSACGFCSSPMAFELGVPTCKPRTPHFVNDYQKWMHLFPTDLQCSTARTWHLSLKGPN